MKVKQKTTQVVAKLFSDKDASFAYSHFVDRMASVRTYLAINEKLKALGGNSKAVNLDLFLGNYKEADIQEMLAKLKEATKKKLINQK